MRRLALLASIAPSFAAAADLFLEDAAWGPVSSRTAGLQGEEERPVRERVAGPAARALVVGGTAERLVGGERIAREDGAVVDGQATVALVDDDHGFEPWRGQLFQFAECTRRTAYLRGGTDPLARKAGTGLVAAGGALLTDFGACATAVHVDGGWSDERGGLWSVEVVLPMMHALGTGDDRHQSFRTGFCVRWPCGALARSPDESPWMVGGSVDYVASRLKDGQRAAFTHGGLAELTLEWRFADHWYAAAQAVGATDTIAGIDDHDPRPAATAALGIGAAW